MLCSVVVPFVDPVAAYSQSAPLSSSDKSSTSTSTSTRITDQLDHHGEGDVSSMYPAAVRRASEIGIILGGKVVAPILLSTLFSAFRPGDYDDGGWDTFWATTTPAASSSASSKHAVISHAARFANALELLGPTYVKFGQALGSRPDVVPPSLSMALSSLQDDMEPFRSVEARDIVTKELMASHHSKEDIKALVSSFSELPVAAASIGQVYEAYLPSTQSGQPPIRVAVKVQRPGVRQVVEQDSKMLLAIAEFLDSIPAISFPPSSSNPSSSTIPLPSRSKPTQRLINTQLVPAVREFMSRILEELDYRNEANNIVTFANLYSEGGSSSRNISSPKRKKNTTIPRVVVPEVYLDWCTENVLVMEWIDGTKLTNVRRREVVNGDDDSGNNNGNGDDDATRKENLALVKVAIDCTLHQLLVTGTLHGEVESSLFYF